MDHTNKKVFYLGTAAVGTTILLMITILFTHVGGENTYLPNFLAILFVRFLQGAITALIPPGLNSITQGIVGAKGMTKQVSSNESMSHLGTSIMFLTGSLLAYWLYPNIGLLFLVSPIALIGVLVNLMQLKEGDIDHDEARGLSPAPSEDETQKAVSPLEVFKDPVLVVFVLICFTFHLANESVLPLVMQTLAIGNGRSGVLMSALCVIIAQAFMVVTAKFCGNYAGIYGRKTLFLVGLLALTVRCAILSMILSMKGDTGVGHDNAGDSVGVFDYLILSTQMLDGVGAGVFGTMYVLVTSDVSRGTGRFNFTLGLTSAAWSIGGTISGYMGQVFAEDYGYLRAFRILGFLSLIPVVLYIFFMPETLDPEEKKENIAATNEKTPLLV